MQIQDQHLQETMCANFQSKLDIFEFVDLNFGKLPNYAQYFGSNNVEGVAESLVEVSAWSSNTHFFSLKKK